MSKRTVAVVDYGMGNLRSVAQAVMRAAREVSESGGEFNIIITADPDVVAGADGSCCPARARSSTACASSESPAW